LPFPLAIPCSGLLYADQKCASEIRELPMYALRGGPVALAAEASGTPGNGPSGTTAEHSDRPVKRAEKPPARDVLLVEDDRVIRDELADILRFEGFTVVTAADGREALDLVHRFALKVIVLDLMLPVMSGNEFARVVRATPPLAALPILTITAVTNAHRAPSGPVFVKPINVDSLLRAVSSCVGRRH
jgi:CheY-like chemotaxis protein